MRDVARLLLALLEAGASIPIEHDPEWPSPCEVMPPDADGMVRWRPIPMEPPATFDGIPMRPELREFYGTFWGRDGYSRHSDESAAISVAWNAAELERITANLAAQVTEGVPVCVAITDSDWYFGVDNATGAVWLCEPGCPPIREVAPSLVAFLTDLVAR